MIEQGLPRTTSLRTCVGCRVRVARSELLRVVVAAGVLTPDPANRLSGRGAHIHLDEECLNLAERRRAFPRALRLSGPLDVVLVREHVHSNTAREPSVQSEAGRDAR